MMYPCERIFLPKRTDTLKPELHKFIGKKVTVVSWHENVSMKDTHPHSKTVGHVEDFGYDIPEEELK